MSKGSALAMLSGIFVIAIAFLLVDAATGAAAARGAPTFGAPSRPAAMGCVRLDDL